MKKFFLSSLRIIIIIVVLTTFLPIAALVVFSGVKEHRSAIAVVRSRVLEIAKSISQLHDHRIDNARHILYTLSLMHQISELDTKTCCDIFAELLRTATSFTGFSIAKPDGEVIASVPGTKEKINFSDRDWYKRLISTKDIVISEYQIGRISGKGMSVIACPVLNNDEKLTAILSVGLDLSWLNQYVSEMMLPENSVVDVIDKNGKIIFRHPDPISFVGMIMPENPFVKAVLEKKEGTIELPGLDGVFRIYGFATLAGSSDSLYVSVGIPREMIIGDIIRRMHWNLVLISLIAVSALCVSLFIAKTRLLNPVKRLISITKRIEGGELSARSGSPYLKGEIGQLAQSFDAMAQSLQNRIGDWQKSEILLRESEKRYRNIINSIPIGMHIYQIEEDGSLVFVGYNPAADKILGLNNGQFIGKTIEDAFPGCRGTELPEKYRLAALKGIPYHAEQIVYEDNLIKGVFEVNAFQTSPDRMAAAFIDITHRKRAEELIRQSEERYRSIFDTAASLIAIISREGVILDCNNHIETMLGYSKEEVTGKAVDSLIHPDSHVHLQDMLKNIFSEGSSLNRELTLVRKDGKRIDAIVNSSALKDEKGEYDRIISIFYDLTELKSLEKQLLQAQKMEVVGRLAGGVAHDFNNMLTAIIGFSDYMLMQMKADDPSRSYLEEIKKAGLRAAELTNQLLAFSRKQILNPVVADLNSLIKDFEKMLKRLIGEDIHLQTFLSKDLSYVKVDPSQLQQVIMNLAVNARDAMPTGGKLTLETTNIYLDEDYVKKYISVNPGHYVMLAISDTGVGMDEETLSHIFEPFFTTKEKGKGTGLGLSTVYGIVEQSGGNILVYSEPGKGSTFKIYLPRVIEDASLKKPEALSQEDLRGNETVLLVEDEDVVRELAFKSLTGFGYTVLMARSGEEVMEILKHYVVPVHLMIADIVMPGINGRELANQLSHLYPTMKVLYMSGYTDNIIVHHGVLDSGMNFIQKPFTPTSLLTIVRKVLDESVK